MKVRRRWSNPTIISVGLVAAWTVPSLITFVCMGILSHLPEPATLARVSQPHPSAVVLAAKTEPSPDPSPSSIDFHKVVPVILATAPPTALDMNQLQLINNARAANGLPPLAWSSCLGGVAASNASRVAAQGQLTHTDGANRDLGCGLGSSLAGENLASVWGPPNDQAAMDMLMASPPHRANILGAAYRYVGAAWAVGGNGFAYLAEEFG